MTILGIACLVLSALIAIDYALIQRAIRQREATMARLMTRTHAWRKP